MKSSSLILQLKCVKNVCKKYDTAAKQDYFLLNGRLHYVSGSSGNKVTISVFLLLSLSPQYGKRPREQLCHSMRHSQDRLPVALLLRRRRGEKKFARRLNRAFFLIPLHWAAVGNLQMLYFLPRSLPRLPSPMAFSDIKLLLRRLLKG